MYSSDSSKTYTKKEETNKRTFLILEKDSNEVFTLTEILIIHLIIVEGKYHHNIVL